MPQEYFEALLGKNSTCKIPTKFGKYEYISTIASGGFSVVCLVQQSISKKKYACKIVSRNMLLLHNLFVRFENEVRILQTISHPSLVSLIDVYFEPNFIFLILELCEKGEIFEIIANNGRFREPEAKIIFRQILDGLEYIHSKNLAHRDLKPENILMTCDNQAKIGDFGFCHFQPSKSLLYTPCGSIYYAPPELLEGIGYDGKMADLWSCGVILFAMCSGTLPWNQAPDRQIIQQIKSGVFDIPLYFSNELTDLVIGLLQVDVKKRYTLNQVLNHGWITGIKILSPSKPSISASKSLISQKSSGAFNCSNSHRRIQLVKQDKTQIIPSCSFSHRSHSDFLSLIYDN